MSKQTKIMIAVLSILGILVLYNVWFFAKKKKPKPVLTSKTNVERSERDARENARGAGGSSRSRDAGPQFVSHPPARSNWGRNPFLLPVEEAEGKPLQQIRSLVDVIDEEPDNLEKLRLFTLGGILYDDEAPVALINTQIHRVGSKLGELFTITEIKRNHVVIADERQSYRLTLEGIEVVLEDDRDQNRDVDDD